MKLRSRIAVICGKLAYWIVRKTGRGSGSVIPGQIARRIDPEILAELSGMVRRKVIAVTGTNGKTTTNHILAHVLEESGQRTVCNRLGANLMDGVITAFVLAARASGKLDADYACIEVDEMASVKVFPKLKPDCVILTNVFRDQLDRTGEVDLICDRIQKAVESVPKARIVVNCDDICSYGLALRCGHQTVTFGIGEQIAEGMPTGMGEGVFCPFCGRRLAYDFVHYGQLGIYRCPGCGLERPRPEVTVTDVAYHDGAYAFVLDGVRVESGANAPYNVYNTLSAYAALKAADAPRDCFARAIREFDYGNMRECVYHINEAHVQLYLAKNPIGFQQKIFLISRDEKPKDIVIQINDAKVDGEDVSWLWDVDYRYLADAGAVSIVTGGQRGRDMELCLKYDDILCSSTTNVKAAVEELTRQGSKNLYIITNYSGLYRTNRMLNEMQAARKEGICR